MITHFVEGWTNQPSKQIINFMHFYGYANKFEEIAFFFSLWSISLQPPPLTSSMFYKGPKNYIFYISITLSLGFLLSVLRYQPVAH